MSTSALAFGIKPYDSVGPISFGATSAQVRAELAPHAPVREPTACCDRFPTLGIRVHYAADNAVEAIEFRGPARPTLEGRPLLRERYGVLEAWLVSLDAGVKLEHSGLASLQLGIRLYAASARRTPDAPVEVVTVFGKDYCRRYIASIPPPPR